jgi:hypothetical protein
MKKEARLRPTPTLFLRTNNNIEISSILLQLQSVSRPRRLQ